METKHVRYEVPAVLHATLDRWLTDHGYHVVDNGDHQRLVIPANQFGQPQVKPAEDAPVPWWVEVHDGAGNITCGHCSHPALQHLTGTDRVTTCSMCECRSLYGPRDAFRPVDAETFMGSKIEPIANPMALDIYDSVPSVLSPRNHVCRGCRHSDRGHKPITFVDADKVRRISIMRCIHCPCTTRATKDYFQ